MHTLTRVKSYSLTLLQDHQLLRSLKVVLSRDHETTAELLAHLAEVASRRLWASEGYPTMLEFCVRGLHMSEGVALKRIQAAKTAEKFPAIFGLVAKGSLHLSAVCMLAPKLTPENATDLLEAATHQTKAAIAGLLATRFPRPDVPTSIRPVESGSYDPDHMATGGPLFASPTSAPPAKVAPLSGESYELRCTLGKQLHEKLRYVQALLGSAVKSNDIPAVLELALDALAEAKEKQKFAVTSRPRKRKGAPEGRHIPAEVRRQVLEKEGGRCTFVSGNGTVCGSQHDLHFDHIVPWAIGGKSTADNLRLRCPAHNRLEAERQFGKGFMDRKVEEARSAAASPEVSTPSETQVPEPEISTLPEQVERNAATTTNDTATPHDPDHTALLAQRADIVSALRTLHFKPADAKLAATWCDHLLGQSLQTCVKYALKHLVMPRFKRCAPELGTTSDSNPIWASRATGMQPSATSVRPREGETFRDWP